MVGWWICSFCNGPFLILFMVNVLFGWGAEISQTHNRNQVPPVVDENLKPQTSFEAKWDFSKYIPSLQTSSKRIWKWMVGRRSFPFGIAIFFRGYVWGSVNHGIFFWRFPYTGCKEKVKVAFSGKATVCWGSIPIQHVYKNILYDIICIIEQKIKGHAHQTNLECFNYISVSNSYKSSVYLSLLVTILSCLHCFLLFLPR